MKKLLLLFCILSNLVFSQSSTYETDKASALRLCEKFIDNYSEENSLERNQMIYYRVVKFELSKYNAEKRESILRKLHQFCPTFLDYSVESKRAIAAENGEPDKYKLWDIFMESENYIPWTEKDKEDFYFVCINALKNRKNIEDLCSCTINEISKKLSPKYFSTLTSKEQAFLGGQVGYVFCSN